MTRFVPLTAVAILSVTAAFGAAHAQTKSTAAAVYKPQQGISLDIGAKRAVGYFMSDARICNLTVLLADAMVDGDETIPAPTRLQFDVAAGSDVRINTTEGKLLAFACATDTKSMTVTALGQMAAYKPKR